LIEFPYVSLLATGKHTEIVLNRGVGLHTVLGMSIDVAMGSCFDKASNMLLKYEKVLKDEQQISQFIITYNKKNPGNKIPKDYFDFLKTDAVHRGAFIEKLAKYGDPSEFELPLGFKT
jgi:tRNA A37 threonylcarbamoyltransferase TsaD